jgi:uncharacterized protein with von Willebrand factor type A (vWA) domain
MSPYEIVQPGGSVEQHTRSVRPTRELVSERMFPLTIAGLDLAIRELQRPLSGMRAAHAVAAATSVTQGPPPEVR